ncbi:THC0290_0291 family protein [Flavobacterium adhaerens]|uniref:THC0290_0291 family protein n=1 Tax=Flavobacterium adhaerens TaxID=3149043 RepID=UPI0032B5B84E
MSKLKAIAFLILFSLPFISFSQGGISHSIGVEAGAVQFRSDYGQRNDFETNIKNTGFGITLIDYMNFSYMNFNNNYFAQHFRVRNELSYIKSDLQHYGEWTEKNSLGSKLLKEMRGSTQIFSFGSMLEYSFVHIHDFERTSNSFAPFIGIGPQISFYSATATSTLGNLGTADTTPTKYLTSSDGHPYGFSNENKAVFSIALNLGTRYKLSPLSDLIFNVKAQYFNSDWVDGLNPNKEIYDENKNNDWLTYIGVGYIYYLSE